MLQNDEKNLLKETLSLFSNYLNSPIHRDFTENFPLSKIWKRNISADDHSPFQDVISSAGNIEQVFEQIFNSADYRLHNNDIYKKVNLNDMYLRYFEKFLPDLLQRIKENWFKTGPDFYDVSLANSGSFKFPGLEAVRLLAVMSRIQELRNDNDFNTYCEIGSGYGGLARVIRTVSPTTNLLLVDIPESLVYSFLFLTKTFGPSDINLILEPNDAEKFRLEDQRNGTISLMPSSLMTYLPKQEIAQGANTHSFGEMTNEVLMNFRDNFLNFHRIEKFYSVNRFLNTRPRGDDFRSGCSASSFIFDSSWDVEHFAFDPKYQSCPFIDGRQRSVECMFSKKASHNVDEKKGISSDAELYELSDYLDIEKFRKITPFHYRISGPHAFDGGKTGELFHCWNKLRNEHSVANAKRFYKYLEMLRFQYKDGDVFEEEEFIQDLLGS